MDIGHDISDPGLVAIDEHGGAGDVSVVREQHTQVGHTVAQAVAGAGDAGTVGHTVVTVCNGLTVNAGMHQNSGGLGLVILQIFVRLHQGVLQGIALSCLLEDAVHQLFRQHGAGHDAVVGESVSLHIFFLLVGMFYGLIAASFRQRSTNDVVGNGSLLRGKGVEDLLNGLLTFGRFIALIVRVTVCGAVGSKSGNQSSNSSLLFGGHAVQNITHALLIGLFTGVLFRLSMNDETALFDAPHDSLIRCEHRDVTVGVLNHIGDNGTRVGASDDHADLANLTVLDIVADFTKIGCKDGQGIDVAMLNNLAGVVAGGSVVQVSVDPDVAVGTTIQVAVADNIGGIVMAMHPHQRNLSSVQVGESPGLDDATVAALDVTLGSQATEVGGAGRFTHFDPPSWKFVRV